MSIRNLDDHISSSYRKNESNLEPWHGRLEMDMRTRLKKFARYNIGSDPDMTQEKMEDIIAQGKRSMSAGEKGLLDIESKLTRLATMRYLLVLAHEGCVE